MKQVKLKGVCIEMQDQPDETIGRFLLRKSDFEKDSLPMKDV